MLLNAGVDNLGLTVVVGIFSALASALAVVLAARYGFLSKRGDQVGVRLAEVERREVLCQDKLFKLRNVVGSLVLCLDVYARACPDAEKEVQETQARLKRRLEEFDAMDEDDARETKTPAG